MTRERSTDDPWEVESPFLDREASPVELEEAWEPRATAIAQESPFAGSLDAFYGPASDIVPEGDEGQTDEAESETSGEHEYEDDFAGVPEVYEEETDEVESNASGEGEYQDREDSERGRQEETEADVQAETLSVFREGWDTLETEEEHEEWEEPAAEESGTGEQWEQLQEGQLSPQPSRPAPNAVDTEAAEPVFSGRVRAPEGPLLDAATTTSSSRWNQEKHPKLSGITLAELCARLERYVDRSALDGLVRRANAGATSPYGSDLAIVVTLLAHQFQRKTCRTPTVGGVTRRCTTDGRIAEDTLDALGFVYHTGKGFNTADQINRVAAATLSRLPASALAGLDPGLSARTWWSYMVSPPWLGLPIKHGIHLVLLKRLRRAQRALMDLPAYANAALSPADLGRTLGLEEEHKGARPGNTDWSMHLFGLAIDIGYTRNPWLSNPKRNTARLAEITLRAARLLGPAGAGDHDQGITARFLHGLAITHGDTGKIHKILAEWSRWLAEYFALAGNAKRLEGLLPTANVMYPNGGWFKRGESLATAAARWARDIRTDFHDFAEAVARGGNKNEVRHGFMDLPRDLVIALRDDACLAWGTVDFGPSVSGDTMHFDCRVEGIGRAIAMTSGKAFVPDSGHRCIPAAGGGRAVERELEQEARRKSPPPPPQKTPSPATPGHWLFPFTSSAIPHYNDKTGNHSTACAIHVPDAAWHKNAIDLLVFFHGDKEGCASTFDPDPKVTSKKFSLDTQIHDSGRKLALAVPAMFWIRGNKDHDANIKGVWTAANFNKFVKEVLAEIGKQSGVTPTLDRLIIAGHSHAYAILTPLACEFDQDAPATKTEALAKLAEVWALDSTYGPWHARALEVWARKRPLLQFIAVLNKNGDPMKYWKNYSYVPANYCAPGFKPPNLTKCTVDDGRDTHCIIPAKYVRLLAAYSAAWCTF